MPNNKNTPPLPTQERLTIQIKTTMPGEQVTIERDEYEQLFVRQAIGPASITISRERQSESGKIKRTASYRTGEACGYATINETIRRKYDYLVAIDSGRFKYMDYDLCIASSYISVKPLVPEMKEIECEPFKSYIFQVEGVHEEIIGWHILFNNFIPNCDFLKEKKICLITDHQEGLHEKMNTGELPYYKNHKLPDNLHVIYAGDRGDHGLNIAVRSCHNRIKTLVKEIMSSNRQFPPISRLQNGEYKCLVHLVNGD